MATWTDRFAPTSLDQVKASFQSKKVSYLLDWMQSAAAAAAASSFSQGRPAPVPAPAPADPRHLPPPRLLLLQGPPGSGKSTLVRLLAEHLGLTVSEYVPPATSDYHQRIHLGRAAAGGDEDPLDVLRARRSNANAPRSRTGTTTTRTTNHRNPHSNPTTLTPTPTRTSGRAARVLAHLDAFLLHAVRFPMLDLFHGDPTTTTATINATTTGTTAPQPRNRVDGAADGGDDSGPDHSFSTPSPPCSPLVWIRDLPFLPDAESRSALVEVLAPLVTESRFPIVLEVTSATHRGEPSVAHSMIGHGRDAGTANLGGGLHRDIVDGLLEAGCAECELGPMTDMRITKILGQVCQRHFTATLRDEVEREADRTKQKKVMTHGGVEEVGGTRGVMKTMSHSKSTSSKDAPSTDRPLSIKGTEAMCKALAATSHGDVRHAILALEMALVGVGRGGGGGGTDSSDQVTPRSSNKPTMTTKKTKSTTKKKKKEKNEMEDHPDTPPIPERKRARRMGTDIDGDVDMDKDHITAGDDPAGGDGGRGRGRVTKSNPGPRKGASDRHSAGRLTGTTTHPHHDRHFSRDIALDPFHALGKFLYNKRTPWEERSDDDDDDNDPQGCLDGPRDDQGQDQDRALASFSTRSDHPRGKMMCHPEDVFARSGLEAGLVQGFLLENYLDFVHRDYLEEAAAAAAAFSDADLLLGRTRRGGFRSSGGSISSADIPYGGDGDGPAAQTAQAAVSVASRGWMWAQRTLPGPATFRAMRGPAFGAWHSIHATNAGELRRLDAIWARELQISSHIRTTHHRAGRLGQESRGDQDHGYGYGPLSPPSSSSPRVPYMYGSARRWAVELLPVLRGVLGGKVPQLAVRHWASFDPVKRTVVVRALPGRAGEREPSRGIPRLGVDGGDDVAAKEEREEVADDDDDQIEMDEE